MANKKEERRNSVRVDDRVLLSYSLVTEHRFQQVRDDFQKGIPLYHQDGFNDIRMSMATKNAFAKLGERDKDLAEILQYLDNKLSMVLDAMRNLEQDAVTSLNSKAVSLSGGGISFWADEEVLAGAYLDLHIVLLPHHSHIYCMGKVITREKQKDQDGKTSWRLGCEFALIMEEDREKIIHHSFQVQSLALRNKRLGAWEP